MVMRRYFDLEIDSGNHRQAGSEKISFVKCTDFCDISSGQHPDTDSHVPGSKIGRSRRTPLIVRGEIHEQRIECRKHNSEPNAHQQCDAENKNRAYGIIPLNQIHAARKQEKLNTTRYNPAAITCVIFPLSTSLPENIREIAMPTAIKVKKNPVCAWIPISWAYIAT